MDAQFWDEQAALLAWDRPWDATLNWNAPYTQWFVGGRLNAAVNCLDRPAHDAGHRSRRRHRRCRLSHGEDSDNPGEDPDDQGEDADEATHYASSPGHDDAVIGGDDGSGDRARVSEGALPMRCAGEGMAKRMMLARLTIRQ